MIEEIKKEVNEHKINNVYYEYLTVDKLFEILDKYKENDFKIECNNHGKHNSLIQSLVCEIEKLEKYKSMWEEAKYTPWANIDFERIEQEHLGGKE